jgi:hypothetical protein
MPLTANQFLFVADSVTSAGDGTRQSDREFVAHLAPKGAWL